MYYNQSNVEGIKSYDKHPQISLEERTKKLYKLLKENKLFGIYITTITVRPSRITEELETWLTYATPIDTYLDNLETYIRNKTDEQHKIIAFNDTISRLDEGYVINLIKYMRRYFNSERGRNIRLM